MFNTKRPFPTILPLLLVMAGGARNLQAESARTLVEESGLQGGLIAYVGAADGPTLASLRPNDHFRVQGIDPSGSRLEAAREHLLAKGIYGEVTVRHRAGASLPYNDNLINLLFVETPDALSEEEMLRVLVPGGAAFVRDANGWQQRVKPRPPQQDDWTHSLYTAEGNAVSRDRIVGPPEHLQWFGGPRWGRQHEHMSSFSALVSDAGRIFYIVDEGSPVSIMLPSDWQLVAKDAANGSLLWKRPIPEWHSRYWPMKNGPVVLPRRLVAMDGRVFATVGIDAPISLLEAATGRTVREYPETAGTYEFVVDEGVLFTVVSQENRFFRHTRELEDMVAERNMIFKRSFPNEPKNVMAVEADSGRVLWQRESQVTQSSLAADGRHVVFHDNEGVICLDRASGERRWKTPVEQKEQYQFGQGATLVLAQDVVLFSGQLGSVTALAAGSGEILWTAPQPGTGHHSPYDIFVIDEQVWYGQTASGGKPGTFVGLNLHSGEVEKTFDMDREPYWFHHRCHRGRATENYIIASRTGVEFIDFREASWDVNHWVRGACTYGVMPANGLLYAPPHPCACYLSTKLSHFNALAPTSQVTYREDERSTKDRIELGPARATQRTEPDAAGPDAEWPFYRHDMARSGATPHAVDPKPSPRWRTSIGGKLSSCVVAGKKVFVASVDRHTVYALDALDGSIRWQYTAGGRVDSPPAVVGGRVVFGAADGSVYCLAASDGTLVWKYDAAPERRQMMALGQLESPWPVHGSVFVQDDVVYAVAGRSRFLDGGMRLVRLDVATGRPLSQQILDHRDMHTQEDLHEQVAGLSMPTGLPDVLSGNGKYLFMHSQVFDLEGNTLDAKSFEDREEEIRHLFTPTGFLDDTWFHRSYWLYGDRFHSGWNRWYLAGRAAPAGRILVHQGDSVFGFGRVQGDYRWVTPLSYHLFQIDKTPSLLAPKQKDSGYGQPTPNKFKYHWSRPLPLLVGAMVLADETLFVAGAPNILDEKEEWKRIEQPDTQGRFAEQAEMLQGSAGSAVWAVSSQSGETLSKCRLESVPVWDGMAAAYGRLYLAMQDGSVICLGGE